MSTKRRRITRSPRGGNFSPKALAAFREMQRLKNQCTCDEPDWDGKYWQHEECAACAAWSKQHSILWDELNLLPHEWPAVENPDAESPYPPDSYAAQKQRPDFEAQARYRALAAAVREAERDGRLA